MTRARTFRSINGRFGLHLNGRCTRMLLRFARRAGARETGGVLVGYYGPELDCAHVTEVSAPPADSRAGNWTFQRGTAGLQDWLTACWHSSRRSYYLGEWHFHPFASPDASTADRAQMMDFARGGDHDCPEPLLLIVGGDPRGAWDLRAYVFSREEGCTPLFGNLAKR